MIQSHATLLQRVDFFYLKYSDPKNAWQSSDDAVSRWVIVFVQSSRTTKALFQHVCSLLSLTHPPTLLLLLLMFIFTHKHPQSRSSEPNKGNVVPCAVLTGIMYKQCPRSSLFANLSMLTFVFAWNCNFGRGSTAARLFVYGESADLMCNTEQKASVKCASTAWGKIHIL